MRHYCIIALLVLASVGCTLEVEDGEEISQVGQTIWADWNPHGMSSSTVGMAISPSQQTYQWMSTGLVCRGNWSNPCGGTSYLYSAPNNNYAAIRGVGIAVNTQRVYAWYSDSTVSQGTSDNLTAHAGKSSFTRPAKPGGGSFSMNDLIEVDNSNSPDWYYYWKGSNNVVWRTTGTSANGSAYSGAQQVTATILHGSIVGITFFNSATGWQLWTFYSDGKMNASTNSLNLVQP